jgi:adenine C2-methylase RlmN of 23S rRNA A2503 and tRNA A37
VNPTVIEIATVEEEPHSNAMKVVFRGKGERRVASFEAAGFVKPVASGDLVHHVCVSTAAGCTRHCSFCATSGSTLGFERLLETSEILTQVEYLTWRQNPDHRLRTVVGFMGNGEPPDNPYLVSVLRELIEQSFPPWKILVSTIGENLPRLRLLTEEFAPNDIPIILYLSLHTADEIKRRRLVPGRRTLRDIMNEVDRYADRAFDNAGNPFPLRLNVTLMDNIKTGDSNAELEDARQVISLMANDSFFSGRSAHRKLKLSSFNNWPGSDFRRPSFERRDAYMREIVRSGVPFYTFEGDGTQIDLDSAIGGFACGQLRATTSLKTRVDLRPPDTA